MKYHCAKTDGNGIWRELYPCQALTLGSLAMCAILGNILKLAISPGCVDIPEIRKFENDLPRRF